MPALVAIASFIRFCGPWLVRVLPWALTVFTAFGSYIPAVQDWLGRMANLVLPSFTLEAASISFLPTDYLSRVNTFIPLDTMLVTLTAFVPFYLACLTLRLTRGAIPGKAKT